MNHAQKEDKKNLTSIRPFFKDKLFNQVAEAGEGGASDEE